MKKIVSAVLLFAALAFSQVNQRVASVQFQTLSSATTTSGFDVSYLTPSKHTLQVVVTGSPAACAVQLEGTLDDPTTSTATWANISGSQTCTSSVTFHVTERAVKGVRANVTSLSGGSSPTVATKYVGVQ